MELPVSRRVKGGNGGMEHEDVQTKRICRHTPSPKSVLGKLGLE